MSGAEAAGLALGIISAIISIIDATNQVYAAVKNEAGLPKNFKKSATKLPLISKLLEDAERYVEAADEATKAAFTPTLENCKVQATQLQELFEKVMPEEGASRWDRYVKAARTIGKGGRVENLVGGILDDLQLLATRFPAVTTLRTKEQLAKAVEEVNQLEASLPDSFEQMPENAHYGSGAQYNNTGSGIQNINSSTGNQHSGSGHQFIGTNHIVQNYASRAFDSADSHGNVNNTGLKCIDCFAPIRWGQLVYWCIFHNDCVCEQCHPNDSNSTHRSNCLFHGLKIKQANAQASGRCSNHFLMKEVPRFQGIVCECGNFKICDTCMSSGYKKVKIIERHTCRFQSIGSSTPWSWYGNMRGVRTAWRVAR